MVTVSADVTEQMNTWITSQMKTGMYKSKGEVIREALREAMKEKQEYQAWFIEREERAAKKQIKYLEEKGLI